MAGVALHEEFAPLIGCEWISADGSINEERNVTSPPFSSNGY